VSTSESDTDSPGKNALRVDGPAGKLARNIEETSKTPTVNASKVREIAARISAARRLARKLAEEKAAAAALQDNEAETELCAATNSGKWHAMCSVAPKPMSPSVIAMSTLQMHEIHDDDVCMLG
jgi:hypothetical protein